MAITDKKTGPWGLDQVYNKINQGSIWDYSGPNELWAWGENEVGELGLNDRIDRSSPTQIPGTTWKNVSINGGTTSYRVFVTKTDGTLWCWGDNYNGELGLNNHDNHKSSPVQVGSDTTWKQASTTHSSSAGVKTDGTLWTWGKSYYGQLGQGQASPVSYSSPVQVPGATWSYVCDGSVSRKAIKTDGTLWAWGFNSVGCFGVNQASAQLLATSSPVQVPGTTWATVVNNKNYNSLAVKTDGTLWSWGANSQGMAGTNVLNEGYSSPTQVGSGTDWGTVRGKIAMGTKTSYAVKTDGTLWAWGMNGEQGNLGQNSTSTERYSSPVQVPGTTWDNVYSADSWVLATRTDGTLWAWGWNGYGGLGQNQMPSTIGAYSSPTQIPGSWNSPGSAISVSISSNIAIKSN